MTGTLTIPRAWRIELAILLTLCAVSGVWGTRFWNQWTARGGQPVFYQTYFEPAVMIACGRGFVISKHQPKPLEDFLFLRTDRFDCADLPASLELDRDHLYQGAWLYLETMVGWTWRLLGISWSGMGPLFGLLFALSIGLAYGICRLSMRPAFALLVPVGLALSSMHLLNLPHLRDYAKTPFALALVLILGLLVSRPWRVRAVLALAALYGLILGIGYGFRTDFLASVPVFLIVVFAFLDGGIAGRLPLKTAAACVCLAVFVAVSWPITSAVYEKGGCQWHVVLLGLQSPFDEHLRITPASYDFGHAYADSYIDRTVNGFRWRADPGAPALTFCSHEYDVQSGRYLQAIVAAFPADFLARSYASILQILELPFRNFLPPMAEWATPLYDARASLLRPDHRWGLLFATLAIWLMGTASLRLAAFLLFVLVYFGGYPALQFQERHYFHLEFIGWWAIAFVLQSMVTAPVLIRRSWPDRSVFIRAAIRSALLLAAVAVAAGAVLAAARWYQARQVGQLLAAYLAAPKTVVEAPGDPLPGLTRAQWPQLLEVLVNEGACGEKPTLVFRYDKADVNEDFTRTIALGRWPGTPGTTRIFMPVFEKYAGLEAPNAGPGCVVSVARVTDLRPFPLLLGAALPSGSESLPLYQRLTDWEIR